MWSQLIESIKYYSYWLLRTLNGYSNIESNREKKPINYINMFNLFGIFLLFWLFFIRFVCFSFFWWSKMLNNIYFHHFRNPKVFLYVWKKVNTGHNSINAIVVFDGFIRFDLLGKSTSEFQIDCYLLIWYILLLLRSYVLSPSYFFSFFIFVEMVYFHLLYDCSCS